MWWERTQTLLSSEEHIFTLDSKTQAGVEQFPEISWHLLGAMAVALQTLKMIKPKWVCCLENETTLEQRNLWLYISPICNDKGEKGEEWVGRDWSTLQVWHLKEEREDIYAQEALTRAPLWWDKLSQIYTEYMIAYKRILNWTGMARLLSPCCALPRLSWE